MLMSSGLGLAIEKNLSKYDIKVLAAEARKQVTLPVHIMHANALCVGCKLVVL